LIPDKYRTKQEHGVVQIDLNRPMGEITAELSKHPVKTQLSLSGTMIVARDIAHAKIKERLDTGEGIPQYFMDHPVYYAGPAKTPEGMPSGSFGPTTAGRMDAYVEPFQAERASMVMIAIGGPAAILAQDHIRKVELLEYPELGMEAIYKIEVEDFPAFILVDDKGNDFFEQLG
jgi:fumarate hydratase class I